MPIRVLKRGCKGSFVAEIQSQLNLLAGYGLTLMGNGSSLYPALVEDGDYGRKTVQRVEEFQKWNPPLKVDGKVGPNTYAKLSGKFWSPLEDAKAAKATPATPVPDLADTLPYYLHDHDVPGTGKVARRHSGVPHWMTTLGVGDLARANALISSVWDDPGDRVSELFVNCHGGSAGSLKIAGDWLQLNKKRDMERLLSAFQSRMAPQSTVYILACCFATGEEEKGWFDWTFKGPMELLDGPGSMAIANVARYLGTRVRAGFSLQRGDLGDIVGLGFESDRHGRLRYVWNGRPRTEGELWREYQKGTRDGLGIAKEWMEKQECAILRFIHGAPN